jgi:hypothetical protein
MDAQPGLVNATSTKGIPLFSSATELFDAWALYIGDPGDYGSCYRGGNLYCAVETNHSGYKAWSGICVPPPCTVAQIMARDADMFSAFCSIAFSFRACTLRSSPAAICPTPNRTLI